MKTLFFTIALFMVTFLVNAQQVGIENVNSVRFKKLIAEKEGTLLDVRTYYEYENGHLKGASQLNYYSFSFKQNLLLLPKDKPVYVYCRSGYRSKRAALILIENGFKKVYNLRNGIKEWERYEYPIVENATDSKD